MLQSIAPPELFEGKDELGLIVDLISACLDFDPAKRPTVAGLLNSPLLKLDKYERVNACRFTENVILYRSPTVAVYERLTLPLRSVSALLMSRPALAPSLEDHLMELFDMAEECIAHVSSVPLDELRELLTAAEKEDTKLSKTLVGSFGALTDTVKVAPNAPLAK